MLEEWQERVIDERNALIKKIVRIVQFSEAQPGEIQGDDIYMLQEQRRMMISYLDILEQRIDRFYRPASSGILEGGQRP